MKIHCIGIGGIGVSGLAQLLHEQGHQVSGSDLENSDIIEEMLREGIRIHIGHNETYLDNDTNKVIYSAAIPESNPELIKAQNLSLTKLSFTEAVHEFSQNYKTIAICGTHGKTTTTAFASLALIAGEKDPTVIIGSKLKEFKNKNYRLGKEDYFIVEACEYKRNFLAYEPNIIILTNLEAEHLDYFKDLEDYKSAYREFINKLPEDGFLIANADDKNVLNTIKDLKCNVVLFSAKNKNYDWFLNETEIYKGNQKVGKFNLAVPGDFNKLNALCGLILGQILNIDRDSILEHFKTFKGTWRRFEEIGEYEGIKLISDYAHHPTAIEKTLHATHEKYPKSKICVIFQPHQYNRTKKFLKEFAESFKEAEFIIIPNIYKVRDTKEDLEEMSVEDFIIALKKYNKKVFHIEKYEEIKEFLKDRSSEIDIAIIMGAGDIWKLGGYILA